MLQHESIKRCAFFLLLLVLGYAGLSKLIWWRDWEKALVLIPVVRSYYLVFAYLVPAVEVALCLAGFCFGMKKMIVYSLRAMGVVFWSFALWLWIFSPQVSCPCVFLGSYVAEMANTGVGIPIKAGLFLLLSVYIDYKGKRPLEEMSVS